MNKTIIILFLLILSCSNSKIENIKSKVNNQLSYKGKIYLYGEIHGEEIIIDREFYIWKEHYDNGLRHLFLEIPYFSAEFLNFWIEQDDNSILIDLYNDLEGALSYTEYTLNFYQNIKKYCPETVFHGTDVGHQYETTGPRFLKFLKQKGLEYSDSYNLAKESILQGRRFSGSGSDIYRENTMVNNFIRELSTVDNQDIMGIYGSSHTGLYEMDYTNKVPSMANQINVKLNSQIESIDLTFENIKLNNTMYTAKYYGHASMDNFSGFEYIRFWKVLDAFEDFKDFKLNNTYTPYYTYIFPVEEFQLYMIKFKMIDELETTVFFLSNEYLREGIPVTRGIDINTL